MTKRIELFKGVLGEWLNRNELDIDSGFYSPDEWRLRGEEFLVDAELILVTEGGLNFLLNYCDDPKLDEFFELCESFDYWFEMGHSWSLGFYTKENSYPETSQLTYQEKLHDSRWQHKAQIVKQKANYKCADCGSKQLLQAHHCWYRHGLEPWQYPLDAFRCLCRRCHQERHEVEHQIRALMARFSKAELRVFRKFMLTSMNSNDIRH